MPTKPEITESSNDDFLPIFFSTSLKLVLLHNLSTSEGLQRRY
ncbi:hypothetical protein BTN50_2040 [Candidatus Enterovibrio altilux]|uniref:Uncharacterized protein n=1 Tax=Candidatus Enterovibrio altilux TaxID=1927128 RepID=A0A291BBT2_9GAMM|nr:hypothetical protein BTN50_2040 [Candidatus Enterovibrio luxaltus]